MGTIKELINKVRYVLGNKLLGYNTDVQKVYEKNRETENPIDNTVEELMRRLGENPSKHDVKNLLIQIIKNAESDKVPSKILKKVSEKITEEPEIPDMVIPDAIADTDTKIPDNILVDIIEQGNPNVKARIEIINNIDDEQTRREQIKVELKSLYNNCSEKNEFDLLEILNNIDNIDVDKNEEQFEKIKIRIIAKKMACNFRTRNGTKIYTLSRYLPVEKMMEIDLPEVVGEEYKKLEGNKNQNSAIQSDGKIYPYNKLVLKLQILDEIAKGVASTYKEIGEFIVPQSNTMAEISEQEEREFLDKIRVHVGEEFDEEQIDDIEKQIRGKVNIQFKDFLDKIRKLPDLEREKFVKIIGEMLENEEKFNIYKQLNSVGILDELQQIPEEDRAGYIDVINIVLKQQIQKLPNRDNEDVETKKTEESMLEI